MSKEIIKIFNGFVIQTEPFKLPVLDKIIIEIPEIEKQFKYPVLQYFIPDNSVNDFLKVSKEYLKNITGMEEWSLMNIIRTIEKRGINE